MRFRKLRIAWSVLWGSVAVLLIVLWVRSYWLVETIRLPTTGRNQLEIGSLTGWLLIGMPHDPMPIRDSTRGVTAWSTYHRRVDDLHDVLASGSFMVKEGERLPPVDLRAEFPNHIFLPYWLPVLVAIALTGAPWLRWRF